jgi:hypothetical protein
MQGIVQFYQQQPRIVIGLSVRGIGDFPQQPAEGLGSTSGPCISCCLRYQTVAAAADAYPPSFQTVACTVITWPGSARLTPVIKVSLTCHLASAARQDASSSEAYCHSVDPRFHPYEHRN